MMCDSAQAVAHFKILHNKINNYLAIALSQAIWLSLSLSTVTRHLAIA
jgi:hypothetical protein